MMQGFVSIQYSVFSIHAGQVKSQTEAERWFRRRAPSSSSLSLSDGLKISIGVDVSSIPDRDGLYKDALLLPRLDIAQHVDPSANIDVIVLHVLENVFNVDIDYLGLTGSRIPMLKPQDGRLDNVLIDAAEKSNLCPRRTRVEISKKDKIRGNRPRHVGD